MKKLIAGIHHFRTNIFGPKKKEFRRLVAGQSPVALFVTCADSRLNPNLITQAEPGDIFILRNAGNIVPPYGAVFGGEAATIEYAVAVLGVRDIIVCGHTNCGAMHALLAPGKLRELPAVGRWLEQTEVTRRIMRENYAHLRGRERELAAIEENVLVQIENLRTHPAVASGLASGKLDLHGWLFELETGIVNAYDPVLGCFDPIERDEVLRPTVAGRARHRGRRRPVKE
ncbi:MAG: carbonic anhydrase [Candidatus Wallbacteria bacterium]|nr:carbonic anhydrase [Candidatus Wallbacteria bacterium]